MWKDIVYIIQYFKGNPVFSLIFTLCFTFLVWMYKELKVMITSEDQRIILEINKILEIYYKLESRVAVCLKNERYSENIKDLFHEFGHSKQYVTQNIKMVIDDMYRNPDFMYLPTMLAFIQTEVNKINKKKSELEFSYNYSFGFMDYLSKLFKPLKAIFQFILLIFLSIVFAIKLQQTDSVYDHIKVLSFVVSILFSFILLGVVMSVISDGKSRIFDRVQWIIMIFLILSPLIWFFYFNLVIIVGFIQISLFLTMVFFHKKNKRRIYIP